VLLVFKELLLKNGSNGLIGTLGQDESADWGLVSGVWH